MTTQLERLSTSLQGGISEVPQEPREIAEGEENHFFFIAEESGSPRMLMVEFLPGRNELKEFRKAMESMQLHRVIQTAARYPSEHPEKSPFIAGIHDTNAIKELWRMGVGTPTAEETISLVNKVTEFWIVGIANNRFAAIVEPRRDIKGFGTVSSIRILPTVPRK